jgi:hypothetical protein
MEEEAGTSGRVNRHEIHLWNAIPILLACTCRRCKKGQLAAYLPDGN